MPSEAEINAALGAMWPRLHESCANWFAGERERLRSLWPPNSIDDSTLLSFELGVYLHSFEEPENRYESSPPAGWIFARTGGDGEHFSVLTSFWPGLVVLTAPMAFGSENLVVGESLPEFLSFVCHIGLGSLVSICYGGGLSACGSVEACPPTDLQAHLIKELGLAPPANPLRRLRELQVRL